MHGLKIAVGGKGGVGKTTVCAVLAQLFAEDGFDILAIDADPNTNLASAFGVAQEKTPEPLIKMKGLIAERTGTGKDAVGTYFKLNPQVSDLPEKYWLRIGRRSRHWIEPAARLSSPKSFGRVKLLVLGGITQAGAGCACPEGAFLRALLTYAILQRKELVIVDLAAGVEFMGRASVQGVDALLLVVEPGGRSIETANNTARMARELGIRNVAAIANKITDASQEDVIESKLKDVTFLGSLPYSRYIQQADLRRTEVFWADEKVVEELRKVKGSLVNLVFPKSDTKVS